MGEMKTIRDMHKKNRRWNCLSLVPAAGGLAAKEAVSVEDPPEDFEAHRYNSVVCPEIETCHPPQIGW
jgi:hypothetical protein